MNHKQLQKIIISILICLLPLTSALGNDTKKMVQEVFEKNFPNVAIDSVQESPLPGFYQVTAGPVVVYTSKDGQYVIDGELIDLHQNNLNLTEEVRKKYRLKSLSAVDKSDMVVFSPKKPQALVYVFTDLDCAYCRKLHRDMEKILAQGVEVRYLAFPRSGVGSPSYDKAVSVWCSDNKNKALSKAKQGKAVPKATCKNPVSDQFTLGAHLGISGTPTIIFSDGGMQPGYLPPAILAKYAKSHTAKKMSHS